MKYVHFSKIAIAILLSSVLLLILSACSQNGGIFSAPASSAHSSDEPASSQTSSKKSSQPSFSSSVTENQTSNVQLNTVTEANKFNIPSKNNNLCSSSDNSSQDIYKKVKDYIINGQNNLSNAERLNWSKRFLDQVNLQYLHKKYTHSGGDANNIQDFAKYITLNAPPAKNWEALFKKDFYDLYGKTLKITKVVNLGDDLYQIYINQNGSEVPLVVVSSRTGYFHG